MVVSLAWAPSGISTSKVHARGPVGVAQLTSFKYKVLGTGQIRPKLKNQKNFIGIQKSGTFNPPHKGHLFISNYAMKRMHWVKFGDCDGKNPLKKAK